MWPPSGPPSGVKLLTPLLYVKLTWNSSLQNLPSKRIMTGLFQQAVFFVIITERFERYGRHHNHSHQPPPAGTVTTITTTTTWSRTRLQ